MKLTRKEVLIIGLGGLFQGVLVTGLLTLLDRNDPDFPDWSKISLLFVALTIGGLFSGYIQVRGGTFLERKNARWRKKRQQEK